MPVTVSNLYTQLNDWFPQVSSTEKLRHIQRAHTRILSLVPLSVATGTNTALVADTKEYSISDTYMKIWSVRYLTSSTQGDSKQLIETSVDELDQTRPDWRGEASGTPAYWYIRGSKIGLHPTPDTSSSASYPQISYEYTADETLTGSSNLPDNARTHEAWLFDAAAAIALSRNDPRYPLFEERRERSLKDLSRMFKGRTARLQPRTVPSMAGKSIKRI